MNPLNVLSCANPYHRARGSCASSTRTTWCTSETEPRRASRSVSISSGTGGGTAAPWTIHLCSGESCRLVSFIYFFICLLYSGKSGTAQTSLVLLTMDVLTTFWEWRSESFMTIPKKIEMIKCFSAKLSLSDVQIGHKNAVIMWLWLLCACPNRMITQYVSQHAVQLLENSYFFAQWFEDFKPAVCWSGCHLRNLLNFRLNYSGGKPLGLWSLFGVLV